MQIGSTDCVRACSSVRLERTPDKREVDGSNPSRPTILGPFFGGVAQLGERLPCTQEVIGSNPFTSTRKALHRRFALFFDNLDVELE